MLVKSFEAQTSPCWCGVEARRGSCQLRNCPRHLTMVQNYEVCLQSPRVAEQYDVNIHSLTELNSVVQQHMRAKV
ncbi:hypothetical protein TNCV_2704781 [Trichonephila clavipes]|nr:hypothetical protein TNCV_2704781 [Trichonephila clavipes]